MTHQGGNPTVLVVEDDANLRRLVVNMLTHGGFETLAVGTATEGLSLIREHQGAFDLAVLDMMMPGMSGLDLASDIEREYPGLKILYMSGFVGSLAADALARRTPERVLLKPFTEQTLLERVRSLLDNEPQREEPGRAPQPPAQAVGKLTSG